MVIPFTGANLVTRRATETVAEVILFFCSIAPVHLAGFRDLSEFIPLNLTCCQYASFT
jgi:hypothetical protein